MVLDSLAAGGIIEKVEPVCASTGRYAIVHDPDGRVVVLTEAAN
jgi:hypothetical protein